MPLFKPTRVPTSFMANVMKRESRAFDLSSPVVQIKHVSNIIREMESKLAPLINPAPRRNMMSVMEELKKKSLDKDLKKSEDEILNTIDEGQEETQEEKISTSQTNATDSHTSSITADVAEAKMPQTTGTVEIVVSSAQVTTKEDPDVALQSLRRQSTINHGDSQIVPIDHSVASPPPPRRGLRPSLVRSGSTEDHTHNEIRRGFANAMVSRSPVASSMAKGIHKLPSFAKHSIDHIVGSFASTVVGEIKAGFNILKDLATHSVANPYQISEMYPRMPWHDVHGCVVGTVSKDVAAHFAQVSSEAAMSCVLYHVTRNI